MKIFVERSKFPSDAGHCPEASDEEGNRLHGHYTSFHLHSVELKVWCFLQNRALAHLSWTSVRWCVCCSCSMSISFRSCSHCWITCCSLTFCSSADWHLIISAHSDAWAATTSFTCRTGTKQNFVLISKLPKQEAGNWMKQMKFNSIPWICDLLLQS